MYLSSNCGADHLYIFGRKALTKALPGECLSPVQTRVPALQLQEQHIENSCSCPVLFSIFFSPFPISTIYITDREYRPYQRSIILYIPKQLMVWMERKCLDISDTFHSNIEVSKRVLNNSTDQTYKNLENGKSMLYRPEFLYLYWDVGQTETVCFLCIYKYLSDLKYMYIPKRYFRTRDIT